MCSPRTLCWASTSRLDALPWLQWGRFSLAGCDAVPAVRCRLCVPSSPYISPWWHSRCSRCLSDGMCCLCWRAGLPATSRSPAQCKRLTWFITMGVGWQGSETIRCWRGASGCGSHVGINEPWLGSVLQRGGEPEQREGRSWENKWFPCSAAPHGQLGQRQERWGEQRASHRHFPHGVSPQKRGELGKINVCWIHFFPRGVGWWTLSGLVCWERCERQILPTSPEPVLMQPVGLRRQLLLWGILRKPLLTHAVQGTNHRCLLYSSYVLHLATSKGAEGSTCFIFELLLKKSNYLHQFLTLFFFPWLCMPGLTVRAKICLLHVSNIFPSKKKKCRQVKHKRCKRWYVFSFRSRRGISWRLMSKRLTRCSYTVYL